MKDPQGVGERRICSSCVRESFLSAEISRNGTLTTCFYCKDENKTFSVAGIADEVERAFEEHFHTTPAEPDGWQYTLQKETNYQWHREGEPVMQVIASAMEIEEDAAEDVRLVLEDRHHDFERDKMGEEGPFDSDTYYAEKGTDDIEYRLEWDSFEDRLKKANRFFDPSATTTLGRIFEGLSEFQTHEGHPVVIMAGPDTSLTQLFRARVFHKEDKLEEALKHPDLELGPPPASLAVAGRMNAFGISVFYGAKEPKTALAEIRPPVGSQVAVACFEIIKPVRLLDVRALEQLLVEGSIFDRTYLSRLERGAFLNRLSRRITVPVMPGDEPLEYLVTQVIADYLANIVKLDGLIYSSAQVEHPTDNVVLFHRASKVNSLNLLDGTELDVQSSYNTDDGKEFDYCVWEKVPQPSSQSRMSPSTGSPVPLELLSYNFDLLSDNRMPTLSIRVDSIEVRHVKGVSFSTAVFPVQRYRLSL